VDKYNTLRLKIITVSVRLRNSRLKIITFTKLRHKATRALYLWKDAKVVRGNLQRRYRLNFLYFGFFSKTNLHLTPLRDINSSLYFGVGPRTHGSEVVHLDATNLSSEVSGYAQQGILGGTDVAGTPQSRDLWLRPQSHGSWHRAYIQIHKQILLPQPTLICSSSLLDSYPS
jgi:hypothetical protein